MPWALPCKGTSAAWPQHEVVGVSRHDNKKGVCLS